MVRRYGGCCRASGGQVTQASLLLLPAGMHARLWRCLEEATPPRRSEVSAPRRVVAAVPGGVPPAAHARAAAAHAEPEPDMRVVMPPTCR